MLNNKQKFVIIVAGGTGKRMGAEIPKQFIELKGKPILMHTIERFYSFDKNISFIVVLPENQHEYWNNLAKSHGFKIVHKLAKGGTERFYSVLNGLKFINNNSLVAIHDGVRPLVSLDTIKRCIETADLKGAAIPVTQATESIRKVTNNESEAVDRSLYFTVQTPQVFKSEIILQAYKQDFDSTLTDDASLVEKAGFTVELVEGNVENIKITRPIDIKIAEALL